MVYKKNAASKKVVPPVAIVGCLTVDRTPHSVAAVSYTRSM